MEVDGAFAAGGKSKHDLMIKTEVSVCTNSKAGGVRRVPLTINYYMVRRVSFTINFYMVRRVPFAGVMVRRVPFAGDRVRRVPFAGDMVRRVPFAGDMGRDGKSRTGFFKQAKKAYPMFPFHEEKIKWDEYGEIIRPEDYIIADPVPQEEEKAKEVEVVPEEEIMQDVAEVPTKCISSTVTLDINASVQYIDFEGRSDGDSIRRYLTQIKPRQLVLIHGTEEATSSLAEYCHSSGVVQGNVFCPSVGDFIDATTERQIYQVRLRDQLVSSLTFSRARDIELTWVDGVINMMLDKTDTTAVGVDKTVSDVTADKDKDKQVDEDEEAKPVSEVVPTLEPLPPTQVPPHTAVFVNEPKLSDFKMVLINAGIPCEFVAGVLICNNVVAVRRESGRIQVEGTLCEDYFKVRELLYEQYAVI
nr:hypothetical protein BaRGS_012306 [Batillaria attramentaria]